MKTDIYQKIEKDFGVQKNAIIEKIQKFDALRKGMLQDRLIRACLFLSNGDVEKFDKIIELAKVDYRDVLFQAEYDESENQIRDFNKSFHELNLL